jgi:hypothetical protein
MLPEIEVWTAMNDQKAPFLFLYSNSNLQTMSKVHLVAGCDLVLKSDPTWELGDLGWLS